MKKRLYTDYQQYLAHQVEKTSRKSTIRRMESKRTCELRRFRKVFTMLLPYLPEQSRVLCLGARYGYEVEAFAHYRFKGVRRQYRAVGIDLVPHPPWVVYGDMYAIPFSTAEFDLVYSNSLDHVHDLSQVLSEVRRVLVRRGLILFHLALNQFQDYESLAFESIAEVMQELPDFRKLVTIRSLRSGLNCRLLLRRRG